MSGRTIKDNNSSNYISVLEMNYQNAFNFFMEDESYCNIELPQYFTFSDLLKKINKYILDNSFEIDKKTAKIKSYENVNYRLYSNKEGKYTWRPLEIIHPLIYIELLKKITYKENWETLLDKFKDFQENSKIKCLSIPIKSKTKTKNKSAQISKWWSDIEQESIKLALEYNYVYHTDVSDCYPSIYTHTIAWAIHGKENAKKEKNNKKLLGNVIDSYLQCMNNGQTNGIPQGSVLMDFIAEIILGYADENLTLKINEHKINDYKILRYRDDYRIFVKKPVDAEKILKSLTEVLLDLGLKLNPLKTSESKQIIISSIKTDKYEWILKHHENENIQKQLLIIHNHTILYPNSGCVLNALVKFYNRLYKTQDEKIKNPIVLISIVTDIAYNSPCTIPVCFSIISKLLSAIKTSKNRIDIIKKIHSKFLQLPNAGFTEIWLQRISRFYASCNITYEEKLCNNINNEKHESIWNNRWVESKELKKIINNNKIYDDNILKEMKTLVKPNEIDLFNNPRY
ncbi:MAG: RNA-directed DNA polymerase [Spirochaetes bacterium]|nr:RNA-directed DNA polymerase [Spirochaetota bacterium]